MFQKILPIKKSTCAAQQILDSIRKGDYPVGGSLPTERVLASEMDARSCIRDAPSILHGLGIVETKRSAGTYFRRLDKREDVMQRTQEFVKQTEDLIQVWEARRQIETILRCQKKDQQRLILNDNTQHGASGCWDCLCVICR